MRPYQPPFSQDLYGGMNDTYDQELVNKYEGSLVQNGIIRNIGSFLGRPGATLVGDDTGSQKILGWGTKRLGARFLTRIVNGSSTSQVQVLSGAAWGNVSGATLTKDRDVFCTESEDAVYYFDGDATHNVGKFDGSNWSLVGGIPKGRYSDYWKNFFFVAGVEVYPRRLYFSNIGTPETFSASDYIDFPDEITSVRGYFNLLVIGTKHTVYLIDGSGPTDFVVSGNTSYVPTGFDFGIASHESLQVVDNDLFGMDHEGRIRRIFRSPSDALFGEVVSDKIEALIAGLNKNALNKVTAAVIDGYYIFYAPNGADTENSIGAYYDSKALLPKDVSRWVKHTGWTPSHFCVWESSSKSELYWGENSGDSKTYKWAGTSDNGAAIEMIWRSGKQNNRYPNRLKLYRWGKQQFKAIGAYEGVIKADIDDAGMNNIKTVSFLGNNKQLGVDWTLGVDELGSKGRLEDNFKFADGGSEIAGKHVQMELFASYSASVPEWYKQIYQFKLLKLR